MVVSIKFEAGEWIGGSVGCHLNSIIFFYGWHTAYLSPHTSYDLATVMWRPTIPDSLIRHYTTLHFTIPHSYVISTAAYAVMYSWWWAWWSPETCRVLEIKAKIIQLHLGYIYTYSCCSCNPCTRVFDRENLENILWIVWWNLFQLKRCMVDPLTVEEMCLSYRLCSCEELYYTCVCVLDVIFYILSVCFCINNKRTLN
jgi:hypothetical protein